MKKRFLIVLVVLALLVAIVPMSAFAVTPSQIAEIEVGNVTTENDTEATVNDWDAIVLERFLADWDVEINLTAADINGNGEVDDWDSIILRRVLGEWEGVSLPDPILEVVKPDANIRTYEPTVKVPDGDKTIATNRLEISIIGTPTVSFKRSTTNYEKNGHKGSGQEIKWTYVTAASLSNTMNAVNILNELNAHPDDTYLITNMDLDLRAYKDSALQEKLVDFTKWEYMLGDYLTGLHGWGMDPVGWQLAKENLMVDGKLYVLPRNYVDQTFEVWSVDYSILEQLGEKELPSDWDKFYEVLIKARDLSADMIPITTLEAHLTYTVSPVAGSYGIVPDGGYQWLTNNGQVSWAFSTDEYLMTLQTMNKLVDDKLIQESPDFKGSILHSYDSEKEGDLGWSARTIWEDPVRAGKTLVAWAKYNEVEENLKQIAPSTAKWGISPVQPVHAGYSFAMEYYMPYSKLGVSIASKDDAAIKRLCAYLGYWSTAAGADEYYATGVNAVGTLMSTNGPNLGMLYSEKQTGARWENYAAQATVSTAVKAAGGAHFRIAWDTSDADLEAKVANLNALAKQFTYDFLQRKFAGNEEAAWNEYLRSLAAAGYNEVYANRQNQLDAGANYMIFGTNT